MKYFLNILLAFFFVWIYLSVIQQHVESDSVKEAAFFIPFHMQIIFWWVVFSFPSYAVQTAQLIGSGIFNGLSYGIQKGGQLLEYLSRNRAGQLAIGGLAVYLIYTYFSQHLTF